MYKRFFLATMGIGIAVGLLTGDMPLGLMIGAALSLAYYLFTAPGGGDVSISWNTPCEGEGCAGGDGGGD